MTTIQEAVARAITIWKYGTDTAWETSGGLAAAAIAAHTAALTAAGYVIREDTSDELSEAYSQGYADASRK